MIAVEFTTRRVATSGHEILNQEGHVIAWTIDEAWASRIVELLNRAREHKSEEH